MPNNKEYAQALDNNRGLRQKQILAVCLLKNNEDRELIFGYMTDYQRSYLRNLPKRIICNIKDINTFYKLRMYLDWRNVSSWIDFSKFTSPADQRFLVTNLLKYITADIQRNMTYRLLDKRTTNLIAIYMEDKQQ